MNKTDTTFLGYVVAGGLITVAGAAAGAATSGVSIAAGAGFAAGLCYLGACFLIDDRNNDIDYLLQLLDEKKREIQSQDEPVDAEVVYRDGEAVLQTTEAVQ